MLNIHTKVFAQNVIPNTLIGGIAKLGGTGVNAPIDSKALLATKLGIASNRITGFKVIGNNIQCRIKGNYIIPAYAFGGTVLADGNQNITYYRDEDALVTAIGGWSFGYCQQLEVVKFLGMTINLSLNYSFQYCTKLYSAQFSWNTLSTLTGGSSSFRNTIITSLDIPNVVTIGWFGGFQGTKISYLNAPKLKTITTLCFGSIQTLVNVDLPKWEALTVGEQSVFSNCYNLETASIPLVYNLPASTFQGCSKLHTLTHSHFTALGSHSLRGNKITNFIANNVTNVGDTVFQEATMTLIELKKCISMGASGNCFNLANTGFTIRTNIFLATSNGGSADVNLANAKTLKGATVEFYDNTGTYVSTL